MAAAMAGKEGDAFAFEIAKHDFIGRIAERRLDSKFAGIAEAAHRVKPAATDYANFRQRLFRPRRFPLCLFCACHAFSPGNYRFRSTGSNSILPSRSRRVAAATSGSCPKTTIQFSFAIRGPHLRFVSSVCSGYRSDALVPGKGKWCRVGGTYATKRRV